MNIQDFYLADGTTAAIMPDYWPFNEVILHQLVYRGLRDLEIASLYKVSLPEVLHLRQSYDV